MNRPEELKYIRLVRFDRTYLQPSIEEYSRTFRGSPAEYEPYRLAGAASGLERYFLAQLLEGYFWLALGIALDLFPEEAAQLLVRQRFALVFPELPAFLRSWGYVFDPELTDLIMTAISQKEFFVKVSLGEFEYPVKMAPSFQSACLMETRFSRDLDGRALVTALNFYYDDLQRVFTRVHKFDERVFNDLENRLDFPSGSIVRGFLKLLEHMSSFGFFLEHLVEDTSIELRDRQLLQRRIKQLCGRRVRWGQTQAYVPLNAMAEHLHLFVPHDVRKYLNAGSLKSEITRLLHTWREDVSKDQDIGSTSHG